jgi:heme-degrading monooxygenase HmoA
MFINLIEFPPIKEGKEKEFLEWFSWSNDIYSKFIGFISRKLLKSTKDNRYAAIVEHESEKTFMDMHTSKERQQAWLKVESLLNGKPIPHFYEVVITSERKK